MISLKYTSSSTSPSGYGSAARQDILALFTAGINLTLQSLQQTAERADYGLEGALLPCLENRKIPAKINIIHLTPDLIPQYQEKNNYTISRLAWETDTLPKEWIEPLNSIDEIWCMSREMVEMIKRSGVTTHCEIFPQPIFTQRSEEIIEPFTFAQPSGFIFYSIFQWIDRKNPRGLLRAYWKAFEGNDDVTLLLKTYRVNYSDAEFTLLKSELESFRRETPQKHYPKIYLCRNLLTEEQIYRLHKTGDCYVNPSSGEGWARPVEEAMLLGKPVISGENGGITDHITNVNYFSVPSHIVKATQQSHIPYYTSDQRWKEIDEDKLGEKMKWVYTNYKQAQEVGKKAQEYVMKNFDFLTVGLQMKKRLEEINDLL